MWLYNLLQSVPEEDWGKVVLAYDNMCHLDGLRAAQRPLPLPAPYDLMWQRITKVCYYIYYNIGVSVITITFFNFQIIDTLHFRNHTDEQCRAKYNPKIVTDTNPNINLMCAEQTFAWLSRYRRILTSMTKTHHLFFLHRLVLCRNAYTELCLTVGRKLLLPSAKSASD